FHVARCVVHSFPSRRSSDLSRADFGRAPSGAKVLRVRGEYVQVVDLAERFELSAGAELGHRFVVLCEAEGGTKLALVVDDIIGQDRKSTRLNSSHVKISYAV